jgi:hypothetical protein
VLFRSAEILDKTGAQPGPGLVESIKNLDACDKINADTRIALLPVQMQHNIHLVHRWLAGLQDPQFTDIGHHFQQRLALAGFKTEVDPELRSTAAYCSFSLRQSDPGFINTIAFGRYAAEKPEVLFNAVIHESIHGLQKQEAAALHASPFNDINDNRIIICPRDWVLLEERCEQDAYAKQSWFNTLLAQQVPESWDSAKNGALSAKDFQSSRDQCGGDLVAGLRLAAQKALHKSFWSDNDTSVYRFVHFIQNNALKNYRAAMNIRAERGQTGFIFVRLRPEHVYAVGQSFGPNVFGDTAQDPSLLLGTPMLKSAIGTDYGTSTEERFQSLQQDLGLTDDGYLPYLDEALAQQGMTLEQFVAKTTAFSGAAFFGSAQPSVPNGP